MGFLISVILIVVGLAICFLGKKYTKVILGVQSGLVAFYIALSMVAISSQSILVVLIGTGVIGIIVGFIISRFLYRWNFIVFGVLFGLVCVVLLETGFGIEGIPLLVLTIVSVIVGGFLGYRLTERIVVLSTSISGATFAVIGFILVSPFMEVGNEFIITSDLVQPTADGSVGFTILLAALALAGVGFMFQRPGLKSNFE